MKKTCEICGKKYEYCPNCPRDMHKPTWMHRFDDEKCKKLWDILSANGMGDISDSEALKQLEDIDYRNIDVQSEALKAHIAKITNGATEPFMNMPVEVINEAKAVEVAGTDGVDDLDEALELEDAMDAALEEIVQQEVVKPKKRRGFKH